MSEPFATETAVGAAEFGISEAAARRLAFLREQEGNERLMLRITVSGGGCSGFQYGMNFDEAVNEDDHVFERDGVKVVIDGVSIQYLSGSEIDFVDEMIGAAFQIKNPNATASCGCGSSFSL